MSEFLSFKKAISLRPTTQGYETAIARWASNYNAQRKATIVAFVKDAEDISAAIAFAKANKLPLAIRGGGHSTSRASSSQDGIVIDLSRHINGVRVDPLCSLTDLAKHHYDERHVPAQQILPRHLCRSQEIQVLLLVRVSRVRIEARMGDWRQWVEAC